MRFPTIVAMSCAAVFAGVFFLPIGRSATAVSAGQPGTQICTVTKVHDGDGPIWCRETDAEGKPIKLRLQAIAARETDESCSPGHPCPAASGAEAKAALQKLVLGRTLRYEATGRSYGRVTAWAWREDGVEINCAMVKSGTVEAWPKYDPDRRLCR